MPEQSLDATIRHRGHPMTTTWHLGFLLPNEDATITHTLRAPPEQQSTECENLFNPRVGDARRSLGHDSAKMTIFVGRATKIQSSHPSFIPSVAFFWVWFFVKHKDGPRQYFTVLALKNGFRLKSNRFDLKTMNREEDKSRERWHCRNDQRLLMVFEG